MKNIFKLVVLLIVGAFLAFSVNLTITAIKKEQVVWNNENKCIAKYIAAGFERANIARANGTCVLVERN